MGVSTASFVELLYFDGGKRYNEYMFENKNKLRGKYICSKPQAELKTDQTVRSIILGAALALFVVPPLCLKCEAIRVFGEKGYTPLITAYVILMLCTAGLMLYTFVASLTRYRLRGEIPERFAPKSGFEKRTFACFEWARVMTVLVAVAYGAMCVYAYSAQSVVLAALECVAAALAVYARKMTFDAYCSSVTLVSAEEAAEAALAEIGPPGAENAETAPANKPETRLKTYNPDAEKNLADEVEDFYSDKD